MSFAHIVKLAAAPAILCAAAAGLCYAAAGNSLGFYFGPVALMCLILPPIACAQSDRVDTLIVGAAAIDGTGLGWLLAVIGSATTFVQWLQCYLVIAAFALALCGLARLVRSASVITVIALAWLSWPVWLSPGLTPAMAAWLSPAHPLLAVNHVMLDLGAWTQQWLMYQLTTLGQDVPYTLPRAIWPCALLHAAIGVTALWLAPRRRESTERSPAPRSAAAVEA